MEGVVMKRKETQEDEEIMLSYDDMPDICLK